eukprot:1721921-Amphidinium_carterae.2
MTTSSYKSATLQRLEARIPQLSVLWGISPEQTLETLQAHVGPGVWMDARILLAIAYLSAITVAIYDEPQGMFRVLQAGSTFLADRLVWPLRYSPGHYSPGNVHNSDALLALVASVPLRPWTLKTCQIFPGGMNCDVSDVHGSDTGSNWQGWETRIMESVPLGVLVHAARDVGQAPVALPTVPALVRPARKCVRFAVDVQYNSCSSEGDGDDCDSGTNSDSTSVQSARPSKTNTVEEVPAPASKTAANSNSAFNQVPREAESLSFEDDVCGDDGMCDTAHETSSDESTVGGEHLPSSHHHEYADEGGHMVLSDLEETSTPPEGLALSVAHNRKQAAPVCLKVNKPCQTSSVLFHSFNINGWKTNHTQLFGALSGDYPHVIALQETLLDTTSSGSASGLMHKLGTKCPGVALIYSRKLQVSPLILHTSACCGQAGYPKWPVLIYNVYLPSGKQAQEQRQQDFQTIYEELETQPDVPAMVVGDVNEDIDRNLLTYQLSMRGWSRPHYETQAGLAVECTYRCGAVESAIDAIYLSPTAFPSVQHHDLLSFEVQLSDSDSVQRPPQSVSFTRGPKYHQHSPVDWAAEANHLRASLSQVVSDYNSVAFTSWSQNLDDAWNHFQKILYRHMLACHDVDLEKHGHEFTPPTVEEFVTPQPAITTSSPPKKTKRTGPMRMRANIYKLIDIGQPPRSC